MVPSSISAKRFSRQRGMRMRATAKCSASPRGARRKKGQPVRSRRSVSETVRMIGLMTGMPASASAGRAASTVSVQTKPTATVTSRSMKRKAAAWPESAEQASGTMTSSAPEEASAAAAPWRICSPMMA
jgi:hypothetical protein